MKRPLGGSAAAAAADDGAMTPLRAGRLAAVLFVLGGVYMAATAEQLPGIARDRIWAGALSAVLTGLVLVLLPWKRMPRWSSLGPPLWAFVVLALPIGAYAHGLSHYLPLYTLLFTYVGLTQRRGTSLAMLPLGLLALLPAWFETPRESSTFLIGPVVVAAVLGEVMAVLTAQHRRSRDSLRALLDATTRLQSATAVLEAADVIAGLARELLSADSACVMLREREGSDVLVDATTVHAPAGARELRVDTTDPGSACGRALAMGSPLWVPDVDADPTLSSPAWSQLDHRAALFLPLGAAGAFEGVAVVQFARPRRRIDATAQRAAQVLAAQAGLVLRRLRETQKLADLATTDSLTGLANRRVFFADLAGLQPGDTIAFVDIDRFKALNDRLGHQHGDEVLRAFGAALRDVLREHDRAARYGGEEFALLLPATDATGALQLLERLRARWAEAYPDVTFSAGVAQHDAGAPTATLGAADTALYDAKRAGRDAVHVSDGTPPAVPAQGAQGYRSATS